MGRRGAFGTGYSPNRTGDYGGGGQVRPRDSLGEGRRYMKQRSWMARVWWWHILMGVPVAATLHSIVQFAYDSSLAISDLGYFVIHIALGIIVGSVILIPAYTVQALLFAWLSGRGAPKGVLAIGCGALQAAFVGLWALAFGLEPSLGGRFPISPVMMVAAFVAGALVALVVSGRVGPRGREE